jgi:hypothetical protein
MKTTEFQLGMRVRRRSGASSFVKDRPGASPAALKGRKVGIIIGLPTPISPKHRGVTVQWEGSASAPETVFIHRLEALPKREQPVALGGSWTPSAETFLSKAVSRT